MKSKAVKSILMLFLVGFVCFNTGCFDDSDDEEESYSGTFVLINNSSYTIDAVYLGPSTSSSWGDDLISDTIAPTTQRSFTVDLSEEEMDYDFLATIEGDPEDGWVLTGFPMVDGETFTYTAKD